MKEIKSGEIWSRVNEEGFKKFYLILTVRTKFLTAVQVEKWTPEGYFGEFKEMLIYKDEGMRYPSCVNFTDPRAYRCSDFWFKAGELNRDVYSQIVKLIGDYMLGRIVFNTTLKRYEFLPNFAKRNRGCFRHEIIDSYYNEFYRHSNSFDSSIVPNNEIRRAAEVLYPNKDDDKFIINVSDERDDILINMINRGGDGSGTIGLGRVNKYSYSIIKYGAIYDYKAEPSKYDYIRLTLDDLKFILDNNNLISSSKFSVPVNAIANCKKTLKALLNQSRDYNPIKVGNSLVDTVRDNRKSTYSSISKHFGDPNSKPKQFSSYLDQPIFNYRFKYSTDELNTLDPKSIPATNRMRFELDLFARDVKAEIGEKILMLSKEDLLLSDNELLIKYDITSYQEQFLFLARDAFYRIRKVSDALKGLVDESFTFSYDFSYDEKLKICKKALIYPASLKNYLNRMKEQNNSSYKAKPSDNVFSFFKGINVEDTSMLSKTYVASKSRDDLNMDEILYLKYIEFLKNVRCKKTFHRIIQFLSDTELIFLGEQSSYHAQFIKEKLGRIINTDSIFNSIKADIDFVKEYLVLDEKEYNELLAKYNS